ncbi:MAG: asparagine synthase (glutamine-hydrolyzing) [Burkholderiales bacterium]|nr:asparagine synthase (glutamine-hydrolyzing) [Burkholderiales bacterium]
MCGIHGIVNLDGSPVAAQDLRAMSEVTRHRGPDDAGFHADGACVIGMNRLSIIDVTGGHQPIANEDDTAWVVCNGEIYNFRELTAELRTRGHRFRTHSDSEILVHAYEEWGDDFLRRLNGMFGFALWDARRRRLLVGRDRLGIKPIYVHETAKRIAFASEAKAILALPDVSAHIDIRGLHAYLQLGYVPSPQSMFEGIRKLPAATLLSVQDGRVEERTYWRLPDTADAATREEQWVERVRDGLRRSVRMQMVSDVPIGAFLSGGVDSSAVVGHMAHASGQPIKTYAIGFEGGKAEDLYNELPHARRIAELFGTDHHEIVVRPDVVGLLPRLLWHMDEPIADSAFVTTYLVSEFARRDVTVILSGVGGDELFGGYMRYLGSHYASRFERLPGWVKQGARAVGRALPSDRHSGALNVMRLAKGFLASSELSFEERYRSYVQLMPSQFASRLLRATPATPFDVIHTAFQRAHGADGLNRMLTVDSLTQLPDDLLMLTDKMSMAVSLECRVPLLDHELVEMAAVVPEAIKIKGGRLKHLMKAALADLLPQDILERKKRGFGVPMGAWLRGPLSGVVDSLLGKAALDRRGYFDPVAVSEIVALHRARREDFTDVLLALVNFEVWARLYVDGRDHADVADELRECVT